VNRSPHAVTWLVWALAATAAVQVAPSPPYVALVIAIAALVVEVHRPPLGSPLSRAFPAVVALGVVFGVTRVTLDVLTTHGVGDALVTLPEVTLPRLMGGFVVGGTVEGTVLASSAAQAFAVVGVMAAFGAFNSVVSHHELLQSAPAAFHEPGLVVTVALALVPSTIAATRAVREADRARTGGRIVRRGRLVRLVVPVLESGMERAVGLAESMDARGFGHDTGGPAERAAGWLGLGGLLALGGSIVALVGRAQAVAWALAVAGGALVVAAVVATSVGRRRARYRRRRPTARDGAVVLAAVATPVGLALLGAGEGGTTWAVTGQLPPFDPRAVLALAGLAAPALWGGTVPAPDGPAGDHHVTPVDRAAAPVGPADPGGRPAPTPRAGSSR
jgi:energy-coupling factor transport system permease protein